MGQSFSDISLYHEYRSVKEKEHLVSQKTWDDLNLDDFYIRCYKREKENSKFYRL